MPWEARDGAELVEFVTIERAGVGVGQEAGALEHHLGGVGDVVDGRVVAPRGEPSGRVVVAQFGPLAEREERLGAPGVAARPGRPP